MQTNEETWILRRVNETRDTFNGQVYILFGAATQSG